MDNQSLENDSQNKKDPKESIPLWLQGLSDRQEEKNSAASDEWMKEEELLDVPNESVEDNNDGSADEELKEGGFNLELEDEEIEEDQEESPDLDELPDWLNELADVSPETPEARGPHIEEGMDWIEEFDELDEEDTEEVEIPAMQAEENIDDISEEQSLEQEEEFKEYTGIEIEEPEDEDLHPEEEIPDWLREMIAAEERHIEIESQKLAQAKADEPTRPVIIEDQSLTSDEENIGSAEEVEAVQEDLPSDDEVFTEDEDETDLPDESPEDKFATPVINYDVEIFETPEKGEFQLLEEMLQEDIETGEEVEEESFSEPEDNEELAEPETHYEYIEDIEASIKGEAQKDTEEVEEVEPISENETPMTMEEESTLPVTLPQSIEPEEAQEDLTEFVDTPDGVMPKFLVAAKSSLDAGNVDEAMGIIHGFINESEMRETIKKWLFSVIETVDNDKSKLWEALGDVAIQEGNHSEAFNAYTKAIKNLENIEG